MEKRERLPAGLGLARGRERLGQALDAAGVVDASAVGLGRRGDGQDDVRVFGGRRVVGVQHDDRRSVQGGLAALPAQGGHEVRGEDEQQLDLARRGRGQHRGRFVGGQPEAFEAARVRVLVGVDQKIVGEAVGRRPGQTGHARRPDPFLQQARQQVRLFVGRPGTDDGGHRVRAVAVGGIAHRVGDAPAGLFPVRDRERRLAAHERAGYAAVALQRLVRAPALVAHPVRVDVGIPARAETEDLATAVIDVDVAPRSAAGADGRSFLQIPDARLEAEILAGQRADRTHVHDVAGVGVVELLARKQADARVVAALEDAQFARFGDLVAEPRAARAEDAALLVEHDLGAQIHDLAFVDLGLQRHVALIGAVLHVVVLEFALAGLVADRAIDGVVDEQEFEHRGLRRLGSVARGLDDHAVGHARVAADLQLGHLFDFDQTHAAVARNAQARVVAVVRHFHAGPLRGLDDVQPVFDRHFAAVDFECGHAELLLNASRSPTLPDGRCARQRLRGGLASDVLDGQRSGGGATRPAPRAGRADSRRA